MWGRSLTRSLVASSSHSQVWPSDPSPRSFLKTKWDPSPNFPFDLPPKLLPTVASPGLHGESWSSGKISEVSVCFDSAEGECLALFDLFDLLIPKTRDDGSRSTPEVVRPARRVAGRKESARVASGSVEP